MHAAFDRAAGAIGLSALAALHAVAAPPPEPGWFRGIEVLTGRDGNADGLVVAGIGVNSQGGIEGWVARTTGPGRSPGHAGRGGCNQPVPTLGLDTWPDAEPESLLQDRTPLVQPNHVREYSWNGYCVVPGKSGT